MANNDPMQIDVVLQATDPLNVSLGEMYKGGDGSFAGLSDVALDNPTNGQVPKYNAETEKWENADDNTVSNLTDLEDVNISNPTDGQIVRYDAETNKFIASDEQVGDNVSVTQSLAQGTKVGEIAVNGQTTELFAPTPASPTEVSVTQIQTTGTKIATVSVDEQDTDLYAPSPTSVSVTQTQTEGTKVGEISVDGQTTELFAPTPTSPTSVSVTQIQSTGTKIATIGVNGTDTDIYAPEGGGGASSADQVSFDDTDVAFSADDVQEALEKITKRLTYEEYEALTDAEKNNGTIYLITNVNGDGQSFQPVIYSEEEREIGVWTNGKPLYEKTIYNAGGTSGVWSFNHNIGNLEMITEANGGCIVHGYSDYSQISWQTLPRTSPDNANIGIVGISDSSISMYVNDAFGNRVTDLYITLRYTKTTDVAGSGTWTPQGVPAHHYSTDEQIVGTWIDGSTIYEKTFNLQSEISLDTSNWTSLGVSLSGVDTPISIEARSSRAINSSVVVDIFDSPMTAKGLDKVKSLTIRYTKSST